MCRIIILKRDVCAELLFLRKMSVQNYFILKRDVCAELHNANWLDRLLAGRIGRAELETSCCEYLEVKKTWGPKKYLEVKKIKS